MAAPTLYVAWRVKAHRARRLRCDWIPRRCRRATGAPCGHWRQGQDGWCAGIDVQSAPRVRSAYTASREGRHCRHRSMKMRSTHCSWNSLWLRKLTRLQQPALLDLRPGVVDLHAPPVRLPGHQAIALQQVAGQDLFHRLLANRRLQQVWRRRVAAAVDVQAVQAQPVEFLHRLLVEQVRQQQAHADGRWRRRTRHTASLRSARRRSRTSSACRTWWRCSCPGTA